MIVAYTLLAICIRQLYVTLKENSGKMKCKGIVGRILSHRFIEFSGDRVCSICGLVQKRGPAGLFISDGDTWYDEGYADNKESLVEYYLGQTRHLNDCHKRSVQAQKTNTINKRIKTPDVRKVATKEDVK